MSAWTDSLDVRTNTVGYDFPHVECKIIDPETGEEVGPGVNGEFCSRGYNTMKGYYKMPEATRDTVDAEGWLHSGDLACKDENGNYRITGRLKDMIIRGGENIYPKEIEEFIYTHPAVRDVQVIGVPDKRYGEEILAAIILKEPGTVTVEEMTAYIRASMARHRVPRYIEFVERRRNPRHHAGEYPGRSSEYDAFLVLLYAYRNEDFCCLVRHLWIRRHPMYIKPEKTHPTR